MTTTPYAPPPPPPPTPPVYAPPAAPAPQKSSGCLKWGLIGCGVVAVLFVAFAAVVTFIAFGAMKRSHVYREALSQAQNDPRVVAALGSPIEAGWWVKGNVHLDSNGGVADLTFPISGPKAKASEHAVATYDGSKWNYERLTVTPDGGTPIDLNKPSQ
jgi:hypothetical protein